jgi:thiamine-phosphate pyrophosphorylase
VKSDIINARLYGIIDLGYIDLADSTHVAESMIEGGVDLIQLRGKTQRIDELAAVAADLHQITGPASVPLIINDYAEIARRISVEGVHVGQDDDSVAIAREKAGRTVIVGKSTHSLEQAAAAQREGADYIGFGPIFATPTKPDYQPVGLTNITQLYLDTSIPIFCIGGIKLDNLPQVIAAGARRAVIVSGLLKATDIEHYAREAKLLLSAPNSQLSTINLS